MTLEKIFQTVEAENQRRAEQGLSQFALRVCAKLEGVYERVAIYGKKAVFTDWNEMAEALSNAPVWFREQAEACDMKDWLDGENVWLTTTAELVDPDGIVFELEATPVEAN